MAFMRPGVRSPSAPPKSSSPFMPFFVYVLKSQLTGSSYVGHTSDLQKRVVEHNRGKSLSTKGKRPWSLLYSEEYASRSEAVSREKYFKSIKGRLELKAKGIF
jgi:putative endonuclease